MVAGFLIVVSAGSADAGRPDDNTDAPPAVAPASTLNAELDDLTGQILGSLQLQQKSTIAVAEFPDLNGTVTELGQFVAEELITRLHRSGNFHVIERRQLSKVMAEHELNMSGIVDGSTARQLGQILGVDAIASGTITDLGEVLKLNARLISTETGTIFAVAAVEIVKDRVVAGLLDRPALADAGRARDSRAQQGSAAGTPAADNSRGASDFPAADYVEGRRAIDRLVAACGGAAKLAAINGYFCKTDYDAKLTIETTVRYPDQVHVLQKAPFATVTRVMSGSQGWIVEPRGQRVLDAGEMDDFRRELRADLVGILRNPAVYTFGALAQRTIEGKPCLPVLVRHVDEDCGLIFLDIQTGLPVMTERSGKSPVTGEPATVKWYIHSCPKQV
jgi:TolB-like protein